MGVITGLLIASDQEAHDLICCIINDVHFAHLIKIVSTRFLQL